MDKLRQVLADIRTQLGKLTPAHQAVVLMAVVIIGLVLFVVSQLSARKVSTGEVLPGVAAGAEQQQAMSHLVGMGFDAKLQGGKLVVPVDQVMTARASLAESQLLPNDKAILFENILQQQSWTNTRQQNEALFKNALENELGQTIRRFSGVRDARVLIDAPEPTGFGQGVRQPTASVAVTSASGRELSQGQVDAIASLVAGSKAGLNLDRVRVIDTVSGRQRRATSEDQQVSGTYLEHASRVEQMTRAKLEELLSYIPGVIVAVTAQVDVTRVESKSVNYLPNKAGSVQLEKKVESQTMTQSQSRTAAVPGVQANQTADITRGGAGGETDGSNTESGTTEYDTQIGSKHEVVLDPRGHPTKVAVSINVPRAFVMSVVKASLPKDAPQDQAPDETALKDAFDNRIKPTILESVSPQVRALWQQSGEAVTEDAFAKLLAQSVGVSMMPLDLPVAPVQSAGLLGSLSGGGGGGVSFLGFSGGLIDKVVVAVLGIAALGMMFTLVKKAGKRPDMPTAEELVGLPPPIEGASEVVGEAEESESAMAGIEVGDGEVESQKKLEQVSQMVEKSPETVARMLNRWIEVEE